MGNIIAAIAVLGALGALFGLILSVASKIFEVKKDPREALQRASKLYPV